MAANVVETKHVRKSQDINSKLPYINQYEIISPLGEGMHGKVTLARDTTTGQSVAIKVMKRIDPHNRRLPKSNRLSGPPLSAQHETESKIRREIAVMKKCTHQNLVRLLEVIDDPASKKIYLVMENLEGGEIKWRSRDHEEPVLELSQIQRIMRDVTLGLEYLHHQGIIHRDIKPANLLWTRERQSVKICDFGVSHFTAAAVQDDPNLYDEAGLTKTAGSPAFFAPEICRIPDISFDDSPPPNQTTALPNGSSTHIPPITKQIDIWALGVTFYCLLFGKPPWSGSTQFAMFRSICNEDFPIPATMARDRTPTGGRNHGPEGKELGWIVVDILERLLEKDQEKRISLADLKKFPWIQNGVREPEKWIRETTPKSDTRVVVTDEEAQSAIKKLRFSWVDRITSTLKKNLSFRRGEGPIPSSPVRLQLPSPASVSKKVKQVQLQTPVRMPTYAGTSSTSRIPEPRSTPQSLSKGRAAKAAETLKRYTFGNVSPPNQVDPRRRNSTAGLMDHPGPGEASTPPPAKVPKASRRLTVSGRSSSPTMPWPLRRPSDSLQSSAAAHTRAVCRGASGSSPSVSPTPSPTTPEDQPVASNSPAERLKHVMRSISIKRNAKGKAPVRSSIDGGTRASAETLDIPRHHHHHQREASTDIDEDDSIFTQSKRASSWGSPSGNPEEDDRVSYDMTSTEGPVGSVGAGIHDFNSSVVRVGAGGYVDGPAPNSADSTASHATAIANHYNSAVGMTFSDGSGSSDGTVRHSYAEPGYHPPRVKSPLSRSYRSDEDEEDSSSVFGSDGDDGEHDEGVGDQYSDDEDALELRTRRPSTILRSANTSPLRR